MSCKCRNKLHLPLHTGVLLFSVQSEGKLCPFKTGLWLKNFCDVISSQAVQARCTIYTLRMDLKVPNISPLSLSNPPGSDWCHGHIVLGTEFNFELRNSEDGFGFVLIAKTTRVARAAVLARCFACSGHAFWARSVKTNESGTISGADILSNALMKVSGCVPDRYTARHPTPDTARHLHQRIAEHKNWAIGRHFLEAHGNNNLLKKNQFTVLRKCQGKFDYLVFEMLFIMNLKPNLNTQTDSIRAKLLV